MYNSLLGNDSNARELLLMLELTPEDFGRFRDCYLSKDGESIIVYTRNGGGNRESYQYVFDNLSKHKYYIKDYDDDFDSTYASIEFKVPDEYKDRCKQLLETADTRTGAERQLDLLNALESGDESKYNKEALENMMNSFKQLFSSDSKGGVYCIDESGNIAPVGDKNE